jgi:NADH:ubiquinone oxidoreductase subunit D
MHANFVRIGGLSQDIPIGTLDAVHEFCARFSSRISEIEDMLTSNRIWHSRLKGVGAVGAQKGFL